MEQETVEEPDTASEEDTVTVDSDTVIEDADTVIEDADTVIEDDNTVIEDDNTVIDTVIEAADTSDCVGDGPPPHASAAGRCGRWTPSEGNRVTRSDRTPRKPNHWDRWRRPQLSVCHDGDARVHLRRQSRG